MGKSSRKLAKQARAALGNRKRKITLASLPWDTGPDTPAQRAGKVIEDATYTDPDTGRKVNPNGVKRARRICLIESMCNTGKISARGYEAAQMLLDAWEATQRSKPAIRPLQVDSSPKPDQDVAVQVDRMSRLARISRMIPPDDYPLIRHVVLENRTVSAFGYRNARYVVGLRKLSDALDSLADRLGL